MYTWVGRLATLVGGGFGLWFAFNVEGLGGIIRANYEIMTFFEIPVFVIVAAGLFSRWANAPGAVAAVILGVGFNAAAAFGWGMSPAHRTFLCFPISAGVLIAGSYLWRSLRGEGEVTTVQLPLLGTGPALPSGGARRWLGLGLSALALILFVGCALGEEAPVGKAPFRVLRAYPGARQSSVHRLPYTAGVEV